MPVYTLDTCGVLRRQASTVAELTRLLKEEVETDMLHDVMSLSPEELRQVVLRLHGDLRGRGRLEVCSYVDGELAVAE